MHVYKYAYRLWLVSGKQTVERPPPVI